MRSSTVTTLSKQSQISRTTTASICQLLNQPSTFSIYTQLNVSTFTFQSVENLTSHQKFDYISYINYFFLCFRIFPAEELKDHLVKRIEKLALQIKDQSKDHGTEPLKKLEDLLDKTFPLIWYSI